MFLMMLASTASAADLHVAFTTGEGIAESWTQGITDAKTRSFGPVEGRGKRSVVYSVTLPPSVFDPLENAFRVEVSICREWVKGSKKDRDCVTEVVMAPTEAEGPKVVAGEVKASDKFEFAIELYYTGEPPIPAGIPEEPAEPEPTE